MFRVGRRVIPKKTLAKCESCARGQSIRDFAPPHEFHCWGKFFPNLVLHGPQELIPVAQCHPVNLSCGSAPSCQPVPFKFLILPNCSLENVHPGNLSPLELIPVAQHHPANLSRQVPRCRSSPPSQLFYAMSLGSSSISELRDRSQARVCR